MPKLSGSRATCTHSAFLMSVGTVCRAGGGGGHACVSASDGVGDFGLQSSPSSVQVVISSRVSSSGIASSNVNTVPMMENLFGEHHLTTVDWTNFRPSPRAHHLADDQHDEPVGPDLDGVHRLKAHLAPVIPHPGGEQLHVVRAVRRDILASADQEQVFGPGTVETPQRGRPGHQCRAISAREIFADLADLFVGHRHPSEVRRTHPVDFGDRFTATADLAVPPPPFGF